MKQRVEVTCGFSNNTKDETRVRPCQWQDPPSSTAFSYIFYALLSIIKLLLKILILWNSLDFFFLKIKKKLLNSHWNLPDIQQRSVRLNAYWKVTDQCLKSGFQWKCPWTFSWLSEMLQSTEKRTRTPPPPKKETNNLNITYIKS